MFDCCSNRKLASLAPWFGVELAEESGGVRVRGYKPGSPAEEVGLQHGDLITTLASRPVNTRHNFVTITQQLRVGDRVEMFVTRGGVNDIVFNVQVTRDATHFVVEIWLTSNPFILIGW
jgi:S1-C subfamily serine protease